MKRDMDLIRSILIAIEDRDNPNTLLPMKIDGYTEKQVNYSKAV
jgi:hypothetical protein